MPSDRAKGATVDHPVDDDPVGGRAVDGYAVGAPVAYVGRGPDRTGAVTVHIGRVAGTPELGTTGVLIPVTGGTGAGRGTLLVPREDIIHTAFDTSAPNRHHGSHSPIVHSLPSIGRNGRHRRVPG